MPENSLNLLFHPVSVVLVSYLLGSLSFAVIVSKLMGLSDPRSYGSKNPGATNVLRSGNKKAAVLTLLFDAVKGWIPVFWVLQQGGAWGLTEGVAAAAGLAAFLGHLYPIFFKFEGGKGVATALGVLMGVSPVLGLAIALTWLGVAWFFRYSSLAALLAALLAPDIVPSWSLAHLQDKGVEVADASGHPKPLALVQLFNADDPPSYVAGTENFFVITRYNRSSYYALAVIELGEAVSRALGE